MRIVGRLVALLLAFALVGALNGCASATVEPSNPGETTLAIGERASVAGISLELVAIEEDSRCPDDVVCIWAGNVKARAIVRIGTNDTAVTLNTGLAPYTVDVGVNRLRIVQVLPRRTNGAAIPRGDYRVTLRVDPIP